MLDIVIGIIIFTLVYLCYLLIIILNKKRLNKYITKGRETNLIKKKYNLDYDKINHKLIAHVFGLSNGLVLSMVYMVMVLVDNVILKFLLALICMVILLLVSYTLIGKFLKGKEVK